MQSKNVFVLCYLLVTDMQTEGEILYDLPSIKKGLGRNEEFLVGTSLEYLFLSH